MRALYFVQVLWNKVVLGSALCKLCSTEPYWEVLMATFVVQSSTGKCFAQALQYKVVLEVLCASVVVQSSTGRCFVQAF